MDTNLYALEVMARDRIETARAAAARRALLPRRPAGPALRVRLGVVLIALGQRLLAGAAPPIRGASAAR